MTASEYLDRLKTMDVELTVKRQACENASGEFQEKLKEDILKLESVRSAIYTMIEELPDHYYRIILIDYYINGMTIEEIAERLNYSTSQVKRKRKKAVKIFAELNNFMKDDTK